MSARGQAGWRGQHRQGPRWELPGSGVPGGVGRGGGRSGGPQGGRGRQGATGRRAGCHDNTLNASAPSKRLVMLPAGSLSPSCTSRLAGLVTAQGCFTGGCLFPPGAGQTHTSPSLAMALGTEITHLRRGSEKLPIWQDGSLTCCPPLKPTVEVQKARPLPCTCPVAPRLIRAGRWPQTTQFKVPPARRAERAPRPPAGAEWPWGLSCPLWRLWNKHIPGAPCRRRGGPGSDSRSWGAGVSVVEEDGGVGLQGGRRPPGKPYFPNRPGLRKPTAQGWTPRLQRPPSPPAWHPTTGASFRWMSEAFPSPGLLSEYRVGMGQPPHGQSHGTQQGQGLETGRGWDVPQGGGQESRAGKLQTTTLQFAKSRWSARRCEAPGNHCQHSGAPGL